MKLDLGSTVDRYVVEAVIGAGGTAMVYRVRHNALGTLHALKVLTVTSDAIRKRMLQEGKVQATLRHLNLVAVTDVLDIGGNPGLLMEYIEGPSLERALGKFKIRMRDAETLFVGVVAGVRQAHRAGVVHRDLKPANVLLARSTEGFVPKVTDFGLVKSLGSDEGIGQTRSGIAMGTPSYMAPEQIRDARTVDQRADIWSLGCILYELMTRRRAFPGDEALAIYNAVTLGDYPDPDRWVDDLPERVKVAIEGCLTVDRDKRIGDCDTLLRVLKGKEKWVPPARPEPEHATDEQPRSLPSDVPDMQVASRGPGGKTPGPAPIRTRSRPAPSAHAAGPVTNEETVFLEPGRSVDGTLNQGDPLTTGSDVAREGLTVVLVGGVAALAMLLTFTGAAAVLLGSYFYGTNLEPSPPPSVIPVEGTPGTPDPIESAPEPDPDPTPRPRPAPAQPSPSPAPVPTPSPAPAPQPAPPSKVTVKLLSSPPTATAWIDGREAGTRTPVKATLSPGRHAVALESGGQRVEYVITVTAGGSNKWCYDFAAGSNKPGGC